MKLVPIFDISKHTLLAIQYDGEECDEYTKALRNWSNIEYLQEFFKENEEDALHGYYGLATKNIAVSRTIELANELEDLVYDKAYGEASDVGNMLQSIFKPLHNNDETIYTTQKTKLSFAWLRIYAIRIAPNCYVVTGSSIKLVKTMQEKQYLIDELQKLEKVKNYLIANELTDEEGFEFLELIK